MLPSEHESLKLLEENSYNVKSQTELESLYIKEWKTKKKKVSHHFIILHDICDYHGRYELLAKSLWKSFNQEINITFVDLKGHGLSSGTRSYVKDFDEYIEDLHIVLSEDETYDTKKILIGQGLGGLVALSYIQKYEMTARTQISSVVLSNPLLYLNIEEDSYYEKILKKLNKYAGKIRFPYHIKGSDLSNDRKRVESYNSDPLINHYISISLVEEIIKKSKQLLDYSYFLDIPLLMLLSKDDFLVNWGKCSLFMKGMPKHLASECIYSHSKHDLFNEKNRDKVFKDIYNWIENTNR
jgi:alpha-beta hydrolase superfamily lysophospholipase